MHLTHDKNHNNACSRWHAYASHEVNGCAGPFHAETFGAAETTLPSAPSSQIVPGASGDISDVDHGAIGPPSSSVPLYPNPARPAAATAAEFGLSNKFSYYMTETYFNPSVFTASVFRAGLRTANPPGKGATQYPPDSIH